MKKIESKDREKFEVFESIDTEDIFTLSTDEIAEEIRNEIEQGGDQ